MTRSRSCCRPSTPTPTGSPGSSPSCWTCPASSRAGWRSTASSSASPSGRRRSSLEGWRSGEPAERFQLLVAGELPETWLDADKVDQVLGNLVENAVRHGAGTVTVVVEPVETVTPGARGNAGSPRAAGVPAVAVAVRDEGDGIDARARAEDLPPVLAGQAPRWHRARTVHRQGAGRGARRDDHCAAGTGGRRRVPIYHARRACPTSGERGGLRPGGSLGCPGRRRAQAEQPHAPDVRQRTAGPPQTDSRPSCAGSRTRCPHRTSSTTRWRWPCCHPMRSPECGTRRWPPSPPPATWTSSRRRGSRTPGTARRSPWPTRRSARCPRRRGPRRASGSEPRGVRSPRPWPSGRRSWKPSGTSGSWSRRRSTSPCPGTG